MSVVPMVYICCAYGVVYLLCLLCRISVAPMVSWGLISVVPMVSYNIVCCAYGVLYLLCLWCRISIVGIV